MFIRFCGWLLTFCAALSVISCGTYRPPDVEEFARRPEHRTDKFPFDPTTPLTSRVMEAPEFILSHLASMDGRDRYRSHSPDQAEKALIQSAFASLPPLTERVMKERLLGVYFVSDFSSSGMTDWAVGRNDKIYGWMVFNAAVLRETATEMLSRSHGWVNMAVSRTATHLLRV